MDPRLSLLLCALVLPGVLLGCRPDDDRFFVRRAGADLPVWVDGDPARDTLVLVQHGLGASGAVYDALPAFDALEERYTFAYWDQAGAGVSQGNPERLSLEESVRDLELVLAAVRERYQPARVFLLGHSLGGGLSLDFLRDPARAEGVDGYIDVSGGRSLPEAYDEVRAFLIAEGERLGDAALVDFYARTVDFPAEEPDRSTHAAHVRAVLAELGYDEATSSAELASFIQGGAVADSFFGPFSFLAFLENTASFRARFDTEQVDLSPEEVSTIPVPALVVAGRFDLSVPPVISERTFAAFAAGRPPSRLAILEDAGHWPMWDAPAAFAAEVEAFVDAR